MDSQRTWMLVDVIQAIACWNKGQGMKPIPTKMQKFSPCMEPEDAHQSWLKKKWGYAIEKAICCLEKAGAMLGKKRRATLGLSLCKKQWTH